MSAAPGQLIQPPNSLFVAREDIYLAIAGLFKAMVGPADVEPRPAGTLSTFSRRLRHWSQVMKDEMPALFMVQKREKQDKVTGRPGKWSIYIDLYLYVNVGEEGHAETGPVVNPIIDAIEAALNTGAMGFNQALAQASAPGNAGFSVATKRIITEARITDIMTDEGVLTPLAVQIIGVEIVATV